MAFFSMTQEVFNACDTVIKVVGIGALMVSGAFAYTQYKDGQEREFKKTFYEKQLATVDNLFEVMLQMDSVETKKQKSQYVKKFFFIYQGSGQIYFTPKMQEAMRLPLDYVRGCVAHIDKPRLIDDCKNYTASQAMFGFARVARQEISTTWDRRFSEIGVQDRSN